MDDQSEFVGRWNFTLAQPCSFRTSSGQMYHESVLRSWHVLERVTEMLRRGDSPETVLGAISLLLSAREAAPLDAQ